jgi:hypothetical protein
MLFIAVSARRISAKAFFDEWLARGGQKKAPGLPALFVEQISCGMSEFYFF